MQNAGAAVSLDYGYNWKTGTKLQGRTIINSGDSNLDYTRVGMWLLGEGEQDGLVEMWDSALGRLLYRNESEDTTTLHFHSGCDAVAGSGSYPSSIGTEQGVDTFWQYLPSGLQPLHYHRWAYYAIKLKQPINNPPNTNQDDESVWADVNPIGLWRGIRCRLFDSAGAMNGYAFTRNPAWHYVDLLCRRKLFPEYSIDALTGADDLPGAVRRRFEWSAISDTVAYFDEVMSNGWARFSGDYSFAQKTSLQACLTQIHTCSRSFSRERNGKYAIIPDRARASVFTFTRKNSDNLVVSDADVHAAANVNVGKFRDILAPAFATVASISCPDHADPVVTTVKPHSAAADDWVIIANTGTRYDGYWEVRSVPPGESVYQMTLKSKGSNYPISIGGGGLMGFRFSRFHERAPEFQHKAHQYARGAVGEGIARQRNKVRVETDFANSTWDQVSRVSTYQRSLALGPDVQPYVAPPKLTLQAPLFAEDAAGSGAVAIQVEPGDVVTVDQTLSDAYAGVYEVMPTQIELTGSAPAQGTQRSPSAGGMSFTLRPYSAANYPDTATSSEPGWPDVPMLPGEPSTATEIPLADGVAAYFTGAAPSGDSFQIPAGFVQTNMLCWASPQGYVEGDGHLHFIQECDAYTFRKVVLIYSDGDGRTWLGDLNYAGLVWRTNNSARRFTLKGVDFVELTLLGGEKVIFGKGIVASGVQVPLPDGYVVSQTVALAFPKTAYESGHPTHGVAAWINNGGVMHHVYQDGEGHRWEGPGQALLFGFLNNGGTWRQHSDTGWWHCPLTDGRALAVAGQSIYAIAPTIYADAPLAQIVGDHLATLPALSAATLQAMPGPNGFQIIDHPAHGVKDCFVDTSTGFVSCEFQDGEGNHWGGSTGVFCVICDTPSGDMGGVLASSTYNPATWPGTG